MAEQVCCSWHEFTALFGLGWEFDVDDWSLTSPEGNVRLGVRPHQVRGAVEFMCGNGLPGPQKHSDNPALVNEINRWSALSRAFLDWERRNRIDG